MSRRGFTLFEVLIAMTIVVILVGTMSTTISVAFKQKRAAEEAVEAVRDTQTVGDIFVKDVGNAMPPNPLSADINSLVYQAATAAAAAGSTANANVAYSGGINGMNVNGTTADGSFLCGPFVGDNISLTFFATGSEPKAPIQAGVRYVEFKLSQQPDNRLALVRRVDTNLLADDPAADLPEEILVTGVTSVQFQYYDGNGWADAWDTTGTDTNNQLPYAVKMILKLEPFHDGGEERVITRFATIWCAQKTISAYAAATEEADTIDSGGITP